MFMFLMIALFTQGSMMVVVCEHPEQKPCSLTKLWTSGLKVTFNAVLGIRIHSDPSQFNGSAV